MAEIITQKEENQLVKVVNESGLEKTKAQVLLDNFSTYFELASDWENKAKALVVTSVDQKAEIKMAREGRLFLREKRIAIEKTRVKLKEESLREGKTIDAIATILKNLIIPIEEDLDNKEKYAEIKAAEERAELARVRSEELMPYVDFVPAGLDLGAMDESNYQKILTGAQLQHQAKIEADKKAEQERLDRIKAEEEERARVKAEHERLKAEAEAREKALAEAAAKRESEKKERTQKAIKFLTDNGFKKETHGFSKCDHFIGTNHYSEFETDNELESFKSHVLKSEELRIQREKAESERKAAEEKARTEREEAAAKLRAEQEAARIAKEKAEAEQRRLKAELQAKLDAEAKAKREAEAKALAEKKAAEEAARKAANAPDKEKLLTICESINTLRNNLPVVSSEDAITVVTDVIVLLKKIVAHVQKKVELL